MTWLTSTNLANLISAALLQKLTDDSDPATEIDAIVIAEVIAETEAEVAGVLSRRYPTQAKARTASVVITSICKLLAFRKLCVRRSDMAITQAQLNEIEHKLNMLNAIAEGRMDIEEWSDASGISFQMETYDANAPESMEDWLINRDTAEV